MLRHPGLDRRRSGRRGTALLATAAAALLVTGAADRAGATGSAYDAIALGDSVVRTMAGNADTVSIMLEAGTSVQVYAAPLPQAGTASVGTLFLTPQGGNQARTTLFRSDPQANVFHSAITVTGTYRIVVTRSAPGSYVLKTRPAGALLGASVVGGTDQSMRSVRAGTPLSASGTLRLNNPGPVGTAFEILQPPVPWLTAPQPTGVAQPGNTDVPVSFSTAGLPHGMHETPLRINPADAWGGSPTTSFWIRSYHPDVVRLFETSANIGELAVLNDAFGLVHIGTQLHRFDTSTGALTEVASGLPANPGGVTYMIAEADGGATAVIGSEVQRVHGDGTRTTLFQSGTGLSGLTAGAGSTYYTRHGTNVWRIEPGVQPYIVGSFRTTGRGLMYNAVDGFIYAPMADQGMQRMHAVSGTVQDVGTFATTVLTPVMAASGRIYINENNIFGGTYVFSPQGEMLTRLIMPGLGWGIALGNGVLFTTGQFPAPERGLYRLAVDDVPMPRIQRSATWGDATLSGAVSAADALVCLSQVVGRAANLADTSSCDVFPDGEGTYTGRITAADALVLLSAAVGNDVSAFRVGQPRS